MECNKVFFSGHAVRRMFERSIERSEVMEVIHLGEVIAEYLDDAPFPSRLLLGFVESRPLHVVVAMEIASRNCYVITAYDPDPHLWEEDFKTRRTQR